MWILRNFPEPSDALFSETGRPDTKKWARLGTIFFPKNKEGTKVTNFIRKVSLD